MTARGNLLLRGMRWRLGLSLLTVLTSTIAVGTAVLGPLYLRTAGDSVVRQTLAQQPINATGVTLPIYQGQPSSYPQVLRAERLLAQIGGRHPFFESPLTSVIDGAVLPNHGNPLVSDLFARTGICRVLHFVSGSCDLGPGDVVVSDRSGGELKAHVGEVLPVAIKGRSADLRLRVTGIYAVPDLLAPYWWGTGPYEFPYGQAVRTYYDGGVATLPAVDPMFASTATALNVPVSEVPQILGQVPLRPGSIGLGNEATLQAGFAARHAAIVALGVVPSTQLLSLLEAAHQHRHQMATVIAIAAGQLVLLAIWVLGSLLARSSDARRSEIRVARLRGFPSRGVLWVTAAEPALLCLLGTVLGIALAWLAIAVARAHLFQAGTQIAFDGWTVLALVVSLLAIAGVLGVGTVRLLRSSGLSQDAAASTRRAGLGSVVTDVVLVVLAAVAIVALATSGALAGHTNPIASAAPGLIALGTAVLAVQVLLIVCRLGITVSAGSRWVAPFLALRQTVRRPELLRQARVLIIALGLACFATSAWSVARSNRAAVARFDVGSTRVATVASVSPTRLQQAVAQADPHARFAMAAVSLATRSSTLLGVDASRLSAAASWPPGISGHSLAQAGRALQPRTAPEVTLAQGPIQLQASATTTTSPAAARALQVAAWVFNPTGGTEIVDLGAVRLGTASYQGDLSVVCPGGCRLAGLGVVPSQGGRVPQSGSVTLTVNRIASGSSASSLRTAASALTPGAWTTQTSGVRLAAGASGGLAVTVTATAIANDTSGNGAVTPPMAAPNDHPATLPAAVTSVVQSINGPGAVPAQGLDGNTLNLAPVVATSALPRVGDDAVMVDLALLSRSQVQPTRPGVSDEVWLGQRAPADAMARLRAAGLDVTGVQTASSVDAQLERGGPALADDFLIVAAIAALLTAAASTLGALGATTRERATELTSLEVTGVPRPVLARSLAMETAILVLTALCGAAAGVVAAVMAIPSLPELTSTPLIPLQYPLPAGVVVLVSAAVVVVVLLASGAIGAVLLRRMSPNLLRTVPDDAG